MGVSSGKRIEVAQLITGENLEVQAVERSHLRVVSSGERGVGGWRGREIFLRGGRCIELHPNFG